MQYSQCLVQPHHWLRVASVEVPTSAFRAVGVANLPLLHTAAAAQDGSAAASKYGLLHRICSLNREFLD